MKKKIVKYLSCIILVILCIVCATVFYVKASGVWEKKPSVEDTNSSTNEEEAKDEGSLVVIDKSGTIISEYICDTALRCEWTILKNSNENIIYLATELFIDTPDTITKSNGGYLTINDEKNEIEAFTVIGTSNQLCTKTQVIEATGDFNITIDAQIALEIDEESGVKADKITLFGTVLASETQAKISNKKLNEIEHISQFPELPSGDEITSLNMVLTSLGYKVDKCDLCDLYLEKGPVGYTDFNKANVGNPRDAYNSYGCLPPVIVNAANKFISANGGSLCAYDYSKRSISELYYEISQGNNVIVWVCEDFDITPSISRIWIVDGKELYLKSNMATMVLVGYDFESKTVTLSNPAGGVFEIDMDLFELRYSQMGAYSVVIK